MKKSNIVILLLTLFVAILFACAQKRENDINQRLSSFVENKAETIWTEQLTTGETRYLTKWEDKDGRACSAVVSDVNSVLSYKTQSICFIPNPS